MKFFYGLVFMIEISYTNICFFQSNIMIMDCMDIKITFIFHIFAHVGLFQGSYYSKP